MKNNELFTFLKQCFGALSLVIVLTALLACGDNNSSLDESDMVTTETGTDLADRRETTDSINNSDLGTGGNQTATENNSSINNPNSSVQNTTDNLVDDVADGTNNVINGVTNGVEDIVDSAAQGVEDVADGITDGAENVINGVTNQNSSKRR